jgi:molybdate transport system substrate-binding protein
MTQLVHADNTTVFAAASLTDALNEIAKNYEASGAGGKPAFSFAGSNVLALQIKQGAPADLFFSADEKQMDAVDKAGLLAPGTRRDFLTNSLVIVVPQASALTALKPQDLAGPEIKRIAVGDTKTVPAGVYTKAYLEKLGLWSSLEPKIVPTANVRAALAAVESGNADAAFVYKTDAAISHRAKVADEIPAAEGPRITYPVAQLKGAPHAEAAQKFLAYLESPAAQAVFTKYGFGIAQK